MSEAIHEWHMIGPITLHLSAEAFNLIQEEYQRQFRAQEPFDYQRQSNLDPAHSGLMSPAAADLPCLPSADDILSAVLNRLAARNV